MDAWHAGRSIGASTAPERRARRFEKQYCTHCGMEMLLGREPPTAAENGEFSAMWMDALAKAIGQVIKSDRFLVNARRRRIGTNLKELHHLIATILVDAKIITQAATKSDAVDISIVEKQVKQLNELREYLSRTGIDKYAGIYIKDFTDAVGWFDIKAGMVSLLLASAYSISDDADAWTAIEDADEDDPVLDWWCDAHFSGGPFGALRAMSHAIHFYHNGYAHVYGKVDVLATIQHIEMMNKQIQVLEQSSSRLRKFIKEKFKIEEI